MSSRTGYTQHVDESKEKNKSIPLHFLADGVKYKLTLIADGVHDKSFATKYLVVDKASVIDVKMLRLGGFAGSLIPIQ